MVRKHAELSDLVGMQFCWEQGLTSLLHNLRWSCTSAWGGRDWLLFSSQAPEPCSSKIPTCSISSPPQFSHKKQSGSNTQNQLLAAMEWLEEHWTLREHGQRCQQPRARPAAPPWVLLPAVELSPNTVQLCVHGAEWWANSSAVRAA